MASLVSPIIIDRFSSDCRKTNSKEITPANSTGANSAMNQSEFRAISYNFLHAREKSRVQDARFISQSLNVVIANRVIAIDNHLS